MQLFKGELRKVGAHRFLGILLLLLLLLNVFMVMRTGYEKDTYGPYVKEMLVQYRADPEGMLALCAEREAYIAEYERLMDEYMHASVVWKITHPGEEFLQEMPLCINHFVPNDLTEKKALQQFYAVLERGKQVALVKDELIERAKYFYNTYRTLGGGTEGFAAQYQVALANRYIAEQRDAVEYPLIYGYGWDNYLTYGGDGIFLLLGAVLLGAVLILPERTGGFAAILRTTKRGRVETALAKTGAAALLSLSLALVFSLVTWLAFAVKYGFSGWQLPLQSVFPYAILHIKVWQAAVLRLLLRALCVFCVVMLCAATSVFFRHMATVCLLGSGTVALFYVFSRLEFFHEHSPLHLFNLFTVISGSMYLESWNAVSVFGHCVDYTVGLPVLLLLVAVSLSAATVVLFARFGRVELRQEGKRQKRVKEALAGCGARLKAHLARVPWRRGAKRHSTALLFYECKKLFGGVLPIVLSLALLVLGSVGTYRQLVLPPTYEEELTKTYMQVLEGELNEEKRQYVLTLKAEIDDAKARLTTMTEEYVAGRLGYEEYTACVAAYNDACEREDVVNAFVTQLEYIEKLEKQGIRAQFVFREGWERLLDSPPNYYLAAFLIFLLSGVFAYERRWRFSSILSSTKCGRLKTALFKFGFSLGLALAASLIAFLCRVALVVGSVGLSALHAPAASIEKYAAFDGNLLQLLVANGMARILGAVVLACLCAALSALFARALPTMAVSVCAVFTVPLLHVFEVEVMDNLMLDGLLGGTGAVLTSAGRGAAFAWVVLVCLLTLVAVKRAKRMQI